MTSNFIISSYLNDEGRYISKLTTDRQSFSTRNIAYEQVKFKFNQAYDQ